MGRELERFDPANDRGRIAYEHLHRYALSQDKVTGKRVLDLACGSGYGTALLARTAAEAAGVDIDAAAISQAKKRYKLDNLNFFVGDCYDLPFEDSTFDVVVANEMVEHIQDHDTLIQQVKRVLSPTGQFFISTPNKPIYNRYKTPNPFHISEMNIPEFRDLLERHFEHVHFVGTRMALVSASFDLDRPRHGANLSTAKIYHGEFDDHISPSIINEDLWLDDPEYLVAVCSGNPINVFELTPSVFYSRDNDLWLEHEKIMAWASQLHEEDEILRSDVGKAHLEVETIRAEAVRIGNENAILTERMVDLRRSAEATDDAFDRQKAALARETEQHIATTSRLLGRLTGAPVDAEPLAIVDAMFSLGEQIVLQRARLETLSGIERRLDAREQDWGLITGERNVLAANVADLNSKLSHAKLEAEALANEKLQTANENETLKIALQVVEMKLASDLQERSDLQEQVAATRDELTAVIRQHKLIDADHIENVEHLRGELEKLSAIETRLDDREQELSRIVMERDRLAGELASVTDELSGARHETEQLANNNAQFAMERDRLVGELAKVTDELGGARHEAELLANNNARAAIESDSLKNALQTKQMDLVANLQQRNDLQDQVVATRDELAATIRRNELMGADHASEVAKLLGEIASLKVRKPEPRPPSLPGNSEAQRNAARFSSAHRKIRAQLVGAGPAISGRLGPPPVPRSKRWTERFSTTSAPIQTAIFDADWISRTNPHLGRISLERFLADPAFRRIAPHPLFDAQAYLDQNFDVATTGISPLLHYFRHGWREGRNPHRFFANDWYLEQNPDVLASGQTNPLDHYLQFGWREGRWPNPVFDPRGYLDRYADVEAAGTEPLTHYVAYGIFENRDISFGALNFEWRHLVPKGVRHHSLMDYLLTADAPEAETISSPKASVFEVLASAPISVADSFAPWPQPPLNDYWPPQSVRNFILDGYGEETLDLYWYLYSVMHFYVGQKEAFPESEACGKIIARAKALATQERAWSSDTPETSIIIPVYNNVLDTLLCIMTVLETATDRSFEIIIADDGSTDATARLVSTIGGIVRHIRQPRNLGFIGNCNAAAAQANGRYVLLLNNDTLVMPRWLDALLEPFTRYEKVGLVGSKLINWDGTLQEAGGIFWEDGSAWNFGRGQDPRAPQFSYLKDTDYCSGASIAIPASLWRDLGGFDPLFEPAYCEDADIAFRLRKAGYRTLFAPGSEVVHHEGRSHGRDLASGIKAYQVKNQQSLLERWQTVLARDHYPNAHNVLCARDRSRGKPHILIIDHYVPQWDQDAGSRTIYQYIKIFLDIGFFVTFWPDNLWRDPKYTPELQNLGVEVIYGVEYRNGFEAFIKDRAELYEAVFISRPHIAKGYLDTIRAHIDARILYYGHDLHFRRMEASRAAGNPVLAEDIQSMRQIEIDVCRKCDIIFYPDPDEVRLIANEVGGDRLFINNPVFVYDDVQIAQARRTITRIDQKNGFGLLFVGGFSHTPNREGIVWFVRSVMPILRSRLPGIRLEIAGSKPPLDVLDLEGEDVSVLGFVSDERLAQLYESAVLSVAPLRYGAGVKGKVIEAMALGVPVATTATGAQGIHPADDMLFVGDSAADFAEAVIKAIEDRAEAAKRASHALDFIQEHYSSAALSALFRRLIAANAEEMAI